MKGTYSEEIAMAREEERKRAWNKIKDKIVEGQIVSRYC